MTANKTTTPLLYRETPCEHGYMEEHYTCDELRYPGYEETSHTDENCHCRGGSREEVIIDYEAFHRALADWYFNGDVSAAGESLLVDAALGITDDHE